MIRRAESPTRTAVDPRDLGRSPTAERRYLTWSFFYRSIPATVTVSGEGVDFGADHREPTDPGEDTSGKAGNRRIVLTKASEIRPRPVRWLWDNRLPLGSLSLLGSREGMGKSCIAYHPAAIARGMLPGKYQNTPVRSSSSPPKTPGSTL